MTNPFKVGDRVRMIDDEWRHYEDEAEHEYDWDPDNGPSAGTVIAVHDNACNIDWDYGAEDYYHYICNLILVYRQKKDPPSSFSVQVGEGLSIDQAIELAEKTSAQTNLPARIVADV